MEKRLETIILPDGLPLDICQQIREYNEGEFTPGLRLFRIAGHRITLPEAHDLLRRIGREDVIARWQIPAY